MLGILMLASGMARAAPFTLTAISLYSRSAPNDEWEVFTDGLSINNDERIRIVTTVQNSVGPVKVIVRLRQGRHQKLLPLADLQPDVMVQHTGNQTAVDHYYSVPCFAPGPDWQWLKEGPLALTVVAKNGGHTLSKTMRVHFGRVE